MTTDDQAERRAVADELESRCQPGGDLSVDHENATWRRHGVGADAWSVRYDYARELLHRRVVDRYLEQGPAVRREGLAAVVTAGPPGAGKSEAIRQIGYDDTWRHIDADEVKRLLIEATLFSDDLFRQLMKEELADGRPLLPMEFASLVHHESTRIADRVLVEALSRGDNVIIEGTLRWEEMPGQLAGELGDAGYESLDVVVVDVPEQVAWQQAEQRWWDGRLAGGLGGRFVPRSTIKAMYDEQGVSLCSENADRLAQAALDIGIRIRKL